MTGIHNDVHEETLRISRVTFYLWMFVASQDLFEDALEFLEEKLNQPLPMDTCFNSSTRSVSDSSICSGQ